MIGACLAPSRLIRAEMMAIPTSVRILSVILFCSVSPIRETYIQTDAFGQEIESEKMRGKREGKGREWKRRA